MTEKKHEGDKDIASQVLGHREKGGGASSSRSNTGKTKKKPTKHTSSSKKHSTHSSTPKHTSQSKDAASQESRPQQSEEAKEVERELSELGKRSYQRDTDTSRKDIFYIGIEDPRDLRREVLGSAKSLVLTLRKFEQIRENRKQKVEYLSQLKALIKEINVLVTKLKGYMPETKLRHLPIPKKKDDEEPVKEQQPAPQPEPKKHHKRSSQESELEKLERELRMIEGKIETIDS